MREIKFRAWDKLRKEMINYNRGEFSLMPFSNLYNKQFREVYTFMQYTGLRDKNGVEIYEGDIVIVENYNHHGKNPNKVMFVYYDNLTAQYCTKIEKTNCKIEDLIMENQPLCFAHSIEIIGNIYENKELLNTDG